MTSPVSDLRSNLPEQVVIAVKFIGKSPQRQSVFKAIYFHKKLKKKVSEIVKITGLDRKRVLERANELSPTYIKKVKISGELGYEQDPDIKKIKNKIIRELNKGIKGIEDRIPTKQYPRGKNKTIVLRTMQKINVNEITIDDISSFSKAKSIRRDDVKVKPLDEKKFKKGLTRVLGEVREFKDWGGEKNDIYTSNLRIGGKRVSASFALKGKASPKVLKPKNLGKNGDQVQRLISSASKIFIIQHWGIIDQSVIEQLKLLTIAKSFSGEHLYYCSIDGWDSQRIIRSYPKCFNGN